MSRTELLNLLTLLVNQGNITPDQRDEVLRLYDAGEITPDQLPMPLAEALRNPEDELQVTLLIVAALLGATFGRRLLAGQGNIPLSRRARVRDRLRDVFERKSLTLAPGAAQGNILTWHRRMNSAIRDHTLQQYITGLARSPRAIEMSDIQNVMREQSAFLYRFAGQMAVRIATGLAVTVGYVAARSVLYGGTGWAAFFRGNESTSDDGMVCIYRAQDDVSTCDRCHAAAVGSPYLPGAGPFPGDVCRGQGRCRCTREMIYDLQAWQRLTGRRIAA